MMTDIIEMIQPLAGNILFALLILIAGYWLSGIISRRLRLFLEKLNLDAALSRFLGSLTYYLLLAVVVIAALERLGVQTASLIALLGTAGLALGLALEGSLSNFAAGVILLIFRPFKVGDLVEIADYFGRIEEIAVFSTILITPDNKTVIIPNSQVTGNPIVNYSTKGLVRLDLVFGIGYQDDLLKAKRVLEEILEQHPQVAKEPAFTVAVSELGDSSVNFAVRPFVDPDHYWNIAFSIHEQVKLRFDAEGITIPFPQRDVHLFPTAVSPN